MKSTFLSHFEIVLPRYRFTQSELVGWTIQNHQQAEANRQLAEASSRVRDEENLSPERIEKLFHRYAVKESQIGFRFIESNDPMEIKNTSSQSVYQISFERPQGLNIEERTRFFSDRARGIFQKIYLSDPEKKKPNHLIHVTCTGYISPSAPQQLVARSDWGQETEITHAYHMGCYASIPAVRLAKALVESRPEDEFRTDIVHTEMCTLHMNPLAQNPEQMVVQTLFADGHIKYSVEHGSQQKLASTQTSEKRLRVLGLLERILPDSEQDMSWLPAPWGMQMNLSREVPTKIKAHLRVFFLDLLRRCGEPAAEISSYIFAVHPGGPKIINAVQEVLELQDEQVAHSKKVLFERGNMSSATLPHVWNEILEANYAPGTRVVSFAFGPGLTLFGAMFEVSG